MGNPDLIVIINSEKIIKIKGTEYAGTWTDAAIALAVCRYRKYIIELKKSVPKPEEIDGEVKKIEIFNF